MNELGIGISWCALQVAAVVVLAGAVCRLLRRDAQAHVSVALTAFVVIAALTITVFVPVPQWPALTNWFGTSTGGEAAPSRSTNHTHQDDATIVQATSNNQSASAPTDKAPAAASPGDDDSLSFAALFASALRNELREAAAVPADRAGRWRWPAWFAVIVLCGLGVGAVRLAAGLIFVAGYRRPGRSRPIEDAALRELLDVIRAELNCRPDVELRESAAVPSAVTFGWRQAVILLPADWQSWTAEERRAVLAHEVAHVSRRDFLLWVAAQLALAMHFYHPLVHWLAGRLRLAQELASDALAAQVAGGREAYLQTLAGMALRQPEHGHAWPVRAFLPTRRTFLRRIEMLKDRRNRSQSSSRVIRWLPGAALVLCGTLLAGFRPPSTTTEEPAAQAAGQSSAPSGISNPFAGSGISNPFAGNDVANTGILREENAEPVNRQRPATTIELTYVPADAVGVVAVRPAALLSSPLSNAVNLRKTMQQEKLGEDQLGIPFDKVEQMTFIVLAPAGPQPAAGAAIPDFGFVIRATEAAEFKALVDGAVPDAVKTESFGQTYYKSPRPGVEMCYARPDDRTIIVDRETNLQRILLSGPVSASKFAKTPSWKEAANAHFAAAFDMSWVRDNMRFAGPNGGRGPLLNPTLLAPFSPLWDDTELMVVSAALEGKQLVVTLKGECSGEKQSARVKETVLAALTLGQNAAREYRKQVGQSRSPEVPLLLTLLNTVDQLLANHSLTQREGTVELKLAADLNPALVAPLLAAVKSARTASQQATARNNLWQIALALHNYHDYYRRFPPAVVYPTGKDGKPQEFGHSWRVAILPSLGEARLYNQYRFDEPWDSEQNMKVLAQMPAVFRHANDAPESNKASYFAVVGEVNAAANDSGGGAAGSGTNNPGGRVRGPVRTLFSDKEGTRISDIWDGTSNTIAVVEARRDIPWTKPEDIPYDEKKPPTFGGWHKGGFHTALGDGSVRFLPDTLDETILRRLLLINDGQSIGNIPE